MFTDTSANFEENEQNLPHRETVEDEGAATVEQASAQMTQRRLKAAAAAMVDIEELAEKASGDSPLNPGPAAVSTEVTLLSGTESSSATDPEAREVVTESLDTPPLQTGEGNDQGPPPPEKPKLGDADDDKDDEGEKPETDDPHVEAERRFSGLLNGLMVQNEVLEDERATFKIIDGANGPEAMVFYERASSDDPDAVPVRMAFNLNSPDEKVPAGTMEEDLQAHLMTGQHVIDELAKRAPTPSSLAELTDVFTTWLDSPQFQADARKTTSYDLERKTDEKTNIAARAESDARNSAAKSLLLGVAKQYDVAKSEGEEIDLASMTSAVMETLTSHIPKAQRRVNMRRAISTSVSKIITGDESQYSVEAGWKGTVSKEAVCTMAVALARQPRFDEILVKSVMAGGLIFKEPELASAFHHIVTGPLGPEVIEKAGTPQEYVERYMVQLLKSYQDSPRLGIRTGRNQQKVRGLLLAAKKGALPINDRLPITSVLQLADAYARKVKGANFGVDDMDDTALAGEGLLCLLGMTRKGDEQTQAAQFAKDQQHAEIIGAFAAHIPHGHTGPFKLKLFDMKERYPGITTDEAKWVRSRYARGEFAVISTWYQRR